MANTTTDMEDNSISEVLHQGKTIAQWEKLLKKDFGLTQNQILRLARSGVDLGRMLQGLDEADSIDNKALFKNEEFFFNEDDRSASIKDYVMPNVQIRVYTADTDDEVYAIRIEADELDQVIMPYIAGVGSEQNNDGFARQCLPIEKQNIPNTLRAYVYVDGERLSTDLRELEKQIKDVQARVARVKRNTYAYRDLVKETDEDAALDESAREPEDVVTVGDFIELLRRRTKLDDKIVFRTNKKEMVLLDVISKGGVAVVDSVVGNSRMNEDVELTADSPIEDFMTVADLQKLGQSTYKNNSDAWLLDNIAGIVNGKIVDFSKVKYVRSEGYPTNGTFFLMDGTNASLEAYEKEKAIMLSEKEKQDVNEGRSWYGGGYGGTGRSYSKLNGRAPHGAEIGWYAVEQLDPKAKGKMPGWRCGPSNFPFKDLFFPNRKYKIGTMVMRNKYVNAGEFSGEVYIAIPSYFEIVKSNNAEGITVLNSLGIPLDLTFGMDPNDDYSVTYN